MPFLCYKTLVFADFLMRRLGQICAVLAVALVLPASAGEPWQEVWDFDSISAQPASATSNYFIAKEVATVMQAMTDTWNARDLEGYLAYFWQSPQLVIVGDGVVLTGWQETHDKYLRMYANRDLMGHAVTARIQVRMLSPDMAYAIYYWSMAFPKTVVVGIDTNVVRRVGNTWKITLGHSTSGEM
jgi:uncharacterized protein (TIGR02246 family)